MYKTSYKLPHPLNSALQSKVSFCSSVNELQQNMCHTDELAKHKHARSWNTDLFKLEKPETESPRAEYYIVYYTTKTVRHTHE